jgi:hypothetical protein
MPPTSGMQARAAAILDGNPVDFGAPETGGADGGGGGGSSGIKQLHRIARFSSIRKRADGFAFPNAESP